jgi:cell division protein FtsB
MQKIKLLLHPLTELNNLVFAVAIVIAISLIWNTISAIEQNFELQTKVDALSEEVSLLELENENLRLSNEYYKTDAYLELAARDKLDKVAAGESVLVLPDYSDLEIPTDLPSQQGTGPEASEISNFDEWLYFLFRREPS